VGIYAPDSLRNFIYSATLSGGLCGGHEFDMHFGSGIIEAFRSSLASVYDRVIMLDTPRPDLQRVFYPEIKTLSANADFSPTTFSVKIIGTIYFKLHITETVLSTTDDIAWKEFFKNDIIISTESSGKAEDCHDAVPYLKKVGEAAMMQLRDSIMSRLEIIK
jgi:hypothetical protein